MVKNGLARFAAVACCIWMLGTSAQAQVAISIDAKNVASSVSEKPLGINLNYLVDDENNRSAARPLTEALEEMGTGFLRYPGGEKSDTYLWSVPPYDRPIPTLARTGPSEWPSSDSGLMEPDGKTFRVDPLDFDEFMVQCKKIKCEPVLVVAYDSMFGPLTPGGTRPTRAQLIESAREWVRYANVVKGYNIKYWEIGNETYLPDSYNGSTTAEVYAKDLIDFSKAMKSIDPTIKIGANGSGSTWWSHLLKTSAAHIDYLSVHSYPAYNWKSYDQYANGTYDFAAEVKRAINSIASDAPAAHRERIKVAMTETGAISWASGAPWANNDLGHSIVVFDIFAQNLKQDKLEFIQLWNTRWRQTSASVPNMYDAVGDNNELFANGKALKLLNQLLRKNMLNTSGGSQKVLSFASVDSLGLSVAIVNKGKTSNTTALNLKNFSAKPSVSRWTLSGTGASDLDPQLSRNPDLEMGSNQLTLSLPPVSITVLEFEAESENLILNPSFESKLSEWENWGSSAAVSTSAYNNYSARSGTAAGGVGQNVASKLKAGVTYELKAYAKISTSSERAWIGFKSYDSSGELLIEKAVEVTSANYALFSVEFTAPAGGAYSYVYSWKSAGTGYLWADMLHLAEKGAPPENLMNNGGFESGLQGWANWGHSRTVSGSSVSGVYSSRTGTSMGGLGQDVIKKLTSGTRYKLTAFAKVTSSAERAWVGIKFVDSSGQEILAESAEVTSTSFAPYSVEVEAPSGAVNVYVYTWKNSGSGYLWVDEVTLEGIP